MKVRVLVQRAIFPRAIQDSAPDYLARYFHGRGRRPHRGRQVRVPRSLHKTRSAHFLWTLEVRALRANGSQILEKWSEKALFCWGFQ